MKKIVSFSGVVIILILCAWIYLKQNTIEFSIVQRDKPIVNPLKGLMVWAQEEDAREQCSLAFVLVKWKDIEPQEGVYDFKKIETMNNWSEWIDRGCRFVIRVVSDYPEEEQHMDIPQWLYDKMGNSGDYYDSSYGKGFSPDYSNSVFQEAHKELMAAMGERYNNDKAVAYIELGSIGHWGEWHLDFENGISPLPSSEVTDVYVQQYLKAFPDKRILMRRPYDIMNDEKIGLYNDSFGDAESNETWLSWVKDGYESDQNGETFSSQQDFWMKAPSGGEFASSQSLEYYFNAGFQNTMDYLKRSHTSFIGPNCPVVMGLAGEEENNLHEFMKELGYCYTISECSVKKNFMDRNLTVNLFWENTGIAPMYENWPVELRLYNEDECIYSEAYDMDIDKFLPGEYTRKVVFHLKDLGLKGSYSLGIAIVDPVTGKPGVSIPINNAIDDKVYKLGEVKF